MTSRWKKRIGFVAFGVAAVCYGNAIALFAGSEGLWQGIAEFGPFPILLMVALWAKAERLPLAELGFTLAGIQRGLFWGSLAGLAMAMPPLGFFIFPVIAPAPVEYAGYQNLEVGALALLLLVRLPIRTVLVEEVLFRGLLQTRGTQLMGTSGGIVFSCALFVLWHGVITHHALGLTNLDASPLSGWLLWGLASIPLAGAGLILSWLRLKTGGLLAPIVAHWLVNAGMALFLSAPRLIIR